MRKLLLGLGLIFGTLAFGAVTEPDRALVERARNLLSNGGFESSTATWSATGGTVASVTAAANVGLGNAALSWDASAASQVLSNTAVTIPAGLYAGNGLARCMFKTTATDYVLQSYNGSNVLASATIPASTQYQQFGVNFPFPSSGSVSLRVVSASDAAVIYMDDCYVGPAANLQSVSQAQVYGTASYAATAGCFWTSTSTSYTNFPANASCPSATVTGQASTPATKIPGITFGSLPPGNYMVVASGLFSPGGSGVSTSQGYRISDGTSSSGFAESGIFATSPASFYTAQNIVGYFSYSAAQSNITFQIQGITNNAGSASYVFGDGSSGRKPVSFEVYRFPSTSELAYRPDQVAWRVDARIGGAVVTNANGEITNASLALASSSDSIPVGIACNSTNPSVVGATTCASGTEAVGVTFVVPTAGVVEACWGANWYNSSGTGTTAFFQLVETGNSDATAIQRPSAVSYQGLGTATMAEFNVYDIGNCQQLYFSSAGQKTLKLFGNSVNGSLLLDGGTAADMSRKFFVTIKPITQSIPAPLLVGSVTSSSTGLERVERVNVRSNCNTASCNINESTPGILSVTRSGTGVYSINFVAGTFSGIPTCAIGTAGGASIGKPSAAGHSSTSFVVETLLIGGASSDAHIYATCQGPR